MAATLVYASITKAPPYEVCCPPPKEGSGESSHEQRSVATIAMGVATPETSEGDPRETGGLRKGDGGVYPEVDRPKHPGDRWIYVGLGIPEERFTSTMVDRWM